MEKMDPTDYRNPIVWKEQEEARILENLQEKLAEQQKGRLMLDEIEREEERKRVEEEVRQFVTFNLIRLQTSDLF